LTCNRKNTRKQSIKEYTDLYSGWDFCIHFRYAGILNVVFTTFMYGYGIPVLFPIAALTFISYYCQEVLLLFYFYNEPPKFDKSVSDLVIKLCMYAPLFYLGFGYWMASSRQLLSNDHLEAREFSTSTKTTNHTLYNFLNPWHWVEGPAWPLLYLFIALLCIQVVLKDWCGTRLRKCSKWAADGNDNLVVDEDLENYWRALDHIDHSWTVQEEKNNRKVFGKVLTSKQFYRAKKMSSFKTSGHTLQGVHSYDILANPYYYESFCYLPANVPKKDELFFDPNQCNLTRCALNLGFIEPNSVQKFRFTEEAMKLIDTAHIEKQKLHEEEKALASFDEDEM
jgi:hypothetical protein